MSRAIVTNLPEKGVNCEMTSDYPYHSFIKNCPCEKEEEEEGGEEELEKSV